MFTRRIISGLLRPVGIAALLAGLGLAMQPVQPAYAAAITVDEIIDDDPTIDNGSCSLREAIIAANTNAAVDACPAGEDANTDIITLANGATYSLTRAGAGENAASTGDLDITNNTAATDVQIVVAGGGTATISQDAIPDDRVLHVRGATVDITGVTIENGDTTANAVSDRDGGGIYNANGTVTITANSTVSNNGATRGGGIYTWGSMTIDASTVSNNWASSDGGGIYTRGSMTIDASTVSNNWASSDGGGIYIDGGTVTIDASTVSNNRADDDGGGIDNHATLTITDSTLSRNSGWFNAGGISNAGTIDSIDNSTLSDNQAEYGGGIVNYGIITSITNSTLSGNFASFVGGGIYNVGTITNIINSTLSDNVAGDGGGVWNSGTINNINYTTITNNAATPGSGIFNDAGGAVTLYNSIVGLPASGDNCGGAGTTTDGGGNLTDTSGCAALPTTATLNLGPLQNNGGPTETHALLAGSSAINNTGACGLTDQRGYARDALCDTGAYEADVEPDLVVTKTNDVGGTTTLGNSWTWTLTISNIGTNDAVFSDGDAIQIDGLPDTDIGYSAPVAGNPVGATTNITNVSCNIDAAFNMLCTASGGSVTIAAGGGSFDVTFTATPTATGTFDNPRPGMACDVNPMPDIVESDYANNNCNDPTGAAGAPVPDTVVVTTAGVVLPAKKGGGPAVLDPAVSKSGDPLNATVGETVVWTVRVRNPGAVPIDGVLVTDTLPDMFDVTDVTTTQGTATVSGRTVTVDVGRIDPGQVVTITITTVANALGADLLVCNVALVGAVEAEGCINLYPAELPPTGGEPVGPPGWVWAVAGAGLALVAGGYVLRRCAAS